MTADDAPAARNGLALVLGSTGIAGVAGYAVQAAVPAFAGDDYLTFTVTWSAIYLVVAAIAGVQQEVTRSATIAVDGSLEANGRRTLARFALVISVAAVLVVLLTSFAWGPAALGEEFWSVLPSVLTATGAYALVAVLSGVFYGARRWRAAAGMTVVDSLLRVLLIVVVIALGLTGSAYAWAIALPFAGSVAILWFIDGSRSLGRVRIDADLSQLIRNSVSTVGAALATGVMISGLPLLLGITSRGLGVSELSALILVLTLTRAPLVIPLLALQSFLVVTFRDQPQLAFRRTMVWGSALFGITVGLAVIGALVGPWIVEIVYGPSYELPAIVFGLIILSAGLTALLCLTGPAALAAGNHRLYVAGWASSSVALLLALFVLPAQLWSTVLAIALAPILGIVVHLSALMRRAPV